MGTEHYFYSPVNVPKKTKHNTLRRKGAGSSFDLVALPQEAADTAGGSGLICTEEPNNCGDATKIRSKSVPYRCAMQRGRCFNSMITLPQPSAWKSAKPDVI